MKHRIYTLSQKTSHFMIVYIFANVNRFSKFFYWHILRAVNNSVFIKYPTTPQLRRYTTM